MILFYHYSPIPWGNQCPFPVRERAECSGNYIWNPGGKPAKDRRFFGKGGTAKLRLPGNPGGLMVHPEAGKGISAAAPEPKESFPVLPGTNWSLRTKSQNPSPFSAPFLPVVSLPGGVCLGGRNKFSHSVPEKTAPSCSCRATLFLRCPMGAPPQTIPD